MRAIKALRSSLACESVRQAVLSFALPLLSSETDVYGERCLSITLSHFDCITFCGGYDISQLRRHMPLIALFALVDAALVSALLNAVLELGIGFFGSIERPLVAHCSFLSVSRITTGASRSSIPANIS